MNEFFANLYEYWVFDPEFSRYVFEANDYQILGLGFISIPIILLLAFYRAIDPLPVRRRKWLLAILLSSLVIFGFGYSWVSGNSMYESFKNEVISSMTAHSFTLQLAFWSVIYGLFPTLLISWIWSRTVSINNARNPF